MAASVLERDSSGAHTSLPAGGRGPSRKPPYVNGGSGSADGSRCGAAREV